MDNADLDGKDVDASELRRMPRSGERRISFRALRGIVLIILITLTYFRVIGTRNILPYTQTRRYLTRTSHPGAFWHLNTHCSHLSPIPAAEYLARQTRLAETLHAVNASAYIAEPGSNAFYFANISTSTWHPSERPLLLVVTPRAKYTGENLAIEPVVTILTPRFEARRASLLHVPASPSSDITFVEWAEHENPYAALKQTLTLNHSNVIVDEYMRYFVARGLSGAGFNILSAPTHTQPILALRERKSSTELALLTCANEATLLALRAVQQRMSIGMRESDAHKLIISALTAAGLTEPSALVLFGENAALPHGSGTDRILGVHEMALFDIGGKLHGYTSDLTRTIALPGSQIPPSHLALWYTVQRAQIAAHTAAREGVFTRSVDAVARTVIEDSGNGKFFTHRLGHGIGLDGHESPYLRGGIDNDAVIALNNTFSNEPGIYREGEVGIRLEDCFAVLVGGDGDDDDDDDDDDEDDDDPSISPLLLSTSMSSWPRSGGPSRGRARLLTEGVGGFARSPWLP